MSRVEVRGVSKWFGRICAVYELDFYCEDGEFLVILGPSGAGKSTTLKLIAGIEGCDTGSIRIGGIDVTKLPPHKRDVAMVFEDYSLYPHFTVRENLAFPLRAPGRHIPVSEIDDRIRCVGELLRIGHLMNRYPRELSQGQRQRVSLGRALVRQPQVFLFDEPISHLDAKLRHSMRRELKRLKAELRQTVIYVTHDYLEAVSLADRVIVLKEGEIQQVGRPDEIYRAPKNAFVASLFGTVPMMFFEGRIIPNYGGRPRFIIQGAVGGSSANRVLQCTLPPKYSSLGERRLILGLRPSEISLEVVGEGCDDNLEGHVYAIQDLFTTKLVTVDLGNVMVEVMVPSPTEIARGQRVAITIPDEHFYLFDPDTRNTIPLSA
ncbi:MAG TPA: ABC transporter ATP-binding protein [Firmicutes bacterium]|nr:ABC transporter ATP-binding protein [Bacillota bacterium]